MFGTRVLPEQPRRAQKRKDPVSTNTPFIEEGVEYDEPKMRQVILYFIHHTDATKLGKTKLMKLLYFADFDHYEQHDEPITGAVYRRLENGPVPLATFDLLETMMADGQLQFLTEHKRVLYLPIEPFDPSLFSDAELQTLHSVAERWGGTTMDEIVRASHDDPPWNAVANGRSIPYHLVYYRNTYGDLNLDPSELEPAEGDLINDYRERIIRK